MNAFLVDLTHGGVKISSELAKSGEYENVFAYDLYGTLKEEDENFLKACGVRVLKDRDDFKEAIESYSTFLNNKKHESDGPNLNINKEFSEKTPNYLEKDLIINPIHSPLNISNLLDEASEDLKLDINEKNQFSNSFEILSHHSATKLVLSSWSEKAKKENVDCIEITGVKGKTSVAYMLKEIMLEIEKDTLLLSSLGAHLFKNDLNKGELEDIVLVKNISITPANIINTIQYANNIVNPKDGHEESFEDLLNYDAAIFENSLGVCGLGDVGVLTNIVENYTIARGSSNAREAKKQVFNCPMVVIEEETLKEHYPKESEIFSGRINTFSIYDSSSNVFAQSIDYNLNQSKIKVRYHDLKILGNEKSKNGEIIIKTFAPGRHHVLNALTALTVALTLGIDDEAIQKGLENFNGIEGRTHLTKVGDSIIIEEINPGINTKAIESSIGMIRNIEDYHIIIGGRYGITCEEIDEDKLSDFLNAYMMENPDVNLILTDELGLSIKKKLDKLNNTGKNQTIKYIESYEEAQNKAIMENKNILFIYRSNYSQISKR
jgi:UDP-N-acetylmuramyl pentapeptide synthase